MEKNEFGSQFDKENRILQVFRILNFIGTKLNEMHSYLIIVKMFF